jgi:hypothetical protein
LVGNVFVRGKGGAFKVRTRRGTEAVDLLGMVRFGGQEFIGFSVPLAFAGRYFVIEPGEPPLVSVVVEVGTTVGFEVVKNEPGDAKSGVTVTTQPNRNRHGRHGRSGFPLQDQTGIGNERHVRKRRRVG